MRLDPTATFRTLISGRSNACAIDLARHAVGRSDARPSPVVFMGPSGSGKSHLLQAAANDFLRRNPSARVLILTANEFCISYLA
jgi:chromosomal replication initiator protein